MWFCLGEFLFWGGCVVTVFVVLGVLGDNLGVICMLRVGFDWPVFFFWGFALVVLVCECCWLVLDWWV